MVYDELSEKDKKKFDASRFKEIDNLLKLNALSVMSPEESDHFAKTTPENIMPTNMLDKWKLQDDGTVAAKSRSVLVGWKDPMIYLLERAAPTPTQEGIMVTLQWLASAKVTGLIADLTNAFGQARKKSRKNKLATELSPGVTHPKVGPQQLLRVETEIKWTCVRAKLVEGKLDCGFVGCSYVKNPYDKCLFTLFSSDETSEGQLLLDVDDFVEGGKETHRKTMEVFYDKYHCGKAVDLMSAGQEGTRFTGRRVVQNPDFRITVSMDEYVKSKLRPIEVPKGYLSNTKEISDGMLTNIKGVKGGLGWLASTARPDMVAPHSIIPSGYDRRSPQLISEVNAAVKQCHAVPITITIWPIPFAELRWTTFTDSSFDTGERQRHQQGWLVCATNKYFNQEQSAPVSALHWRSRKLTRQAGSPQLVETYAASSEVVEMTWIKALWESMTWKDVHFLTQRRSSRPLKNHDAACDPQRKSSSLRF